MVNAHQEEVFKWPRHPFPAGLDIEVYLNGEWVDHTETYVAVAGLVELGPLTMYRLTQVGSVAPKPPAPNVLQAVQSLALYQLIWSPQRREFKSQSAGDTSLNREQLMGLFYGSGAGILLANEVRQ